MGKNVIYGFFIPLDKVIKWRGIRYEQMGGGQALFSPSQMRYQEFFHIIHDKYFLQKALN